MRYYVSKYTLKINETKLDHIKQEYENQPITIDSLLKIVIECIYIERS